MKRTTTIKLILLSVIILATAACADSRSGAGDYYLEDGVPDLEAYATSAKATEGQSCAKVSCAGNLACVSVYTPSPRKLLGKFCMTKCQTLGADPSCNGGEVCTRVSTRTVCFNSNNPAQGYTSPPEPSVPDAVCAWKGETLTGQINASGETERGGYLNNEQVNLAPKFYNDTDQEVLLTKVSVRIYSLLDASVAAEQVLLENLTLPRQVAVCPTALKLWSIPGAQAVGPYGVELILSRADEPASTVVPLTFFRVLAANELTLFSISEQSANGLRVFLEDGGMSAEYAVGKSLEVLAPGVGHSWYPQSAGMGPRPVFSTPRFLVDSVKRTVDYYDNFLGSTTVFKTIIIGTGVAPVPYLSNALNAPVLPLHFLVSANTVKEINQIIKYTLNEGIAAYSTVGYDYSVPKYATTWVKLLSLPPAYVDFLKRHKVENVVLIGSTATIGETTAKKVLSAAVATGDSLRSGDIYLLYPGGGTSADISNLSSRLRDYNELQLESSYRHIADWESGIAPEQIAAFCAAAKQGASIGKCLLAGSADTGELYNLAAYATLALMKKNESYLSQIRPGPSVVKGVVLNPYLLSHPFYELLAGYVPALFWQGNGATWIVDSLVDITIRQASAAVYPSVAFNQLTFWQNLTNNFGGFLDGALTSALTAKGLTNIIKSDVSADEVWSASDGKTSPAEFVAQELVKLGPSQVSQWRAAIAPLTLDELANIAKTYPAIQMEFIIAPSTR